MISQRNMKLKLNLLLALLFLISNRVGCVMQLKQIVDILNMDFVLPSESAEKMQKVTVPTVYYSPYQTEQNTLLDNY